jgi:hypothetical protein
MDYDPFLKIDSINYGIIAVNRSDFFLETSYFIDSWSDWTDMKIYPIDEGIVRDFRIRFNESGVLHSIKFKYTGYPNETVGALDIRFVTILPLTPDCKDVLIVYCGVEGEDVQYISIQIVESDYETVNPMIELVETLQSVWTANLGIFPTGYYVFEVVAISDTDLVSARLPIIVLDVPPDLGESIVIAQSLIAVTTVIVLASMIFSFALIMQKINAVIEKLPLNQE